MVTWPVLDASRAGSRFSRGVATAQGHFCAMAKGEPCLRGQFCPCFFLVCFVFVGAWLSYTQFHVETQGAHVAALYPLFQPWSVDISFCLAHLTRHLILPLGSLGPREGLFPAQVLRWQEPGERPRGHCASLRKFCFYSEESSSKRGFLPLISISTIFSFFPSLPCGFSKV